jgi:hypothetical protein
MSEVLRGKALALVLEHAAITDESGRPVDLDNLTREFEPEAAEGAVDEDTDDEDEDIAAETAQDAAAEDTDAETAQDA